MHVQRRRRVVRLLARDGVTRKVNMRLPGKGNSHTHGARPVHQIISTMKWIRTGKLSIQNSLSDMHVQRRRYVVCLYACAGKSR